MSEAKHSRWCMSTPTVGVPIGPCDCGADPARLTDQQIEEMETNLRSGKWCLTNADSLSLIANLRAERATNENLREALERYADPAEWSTRRGPKGGPMIAQKALDA